MRNIIFKTKGFTLIEMMVTLGIVTFLMAMVLTYSRQSESITNLIRNSDRMIYELYRAQNSAMLTLQQSSGQAICGWGIYVNREVLPQTQYILFSDFCDTGTRKQYDSGEEVENINLFKRIIIDSSNVSSVIFVPPEPQTKFHPNLNEGENASIKMCLETNPNCFIIHITPAGQIYKKKS